MAEPDTRPLRRSRHPRWVLRNEGAEGGPYRFRITPGKARIIGRSTNADFVLEDVLISRFHCSLSVTDGELTVENLSSANGTFVNERRVERAVLKAHDRLLVGRVEFIVSAEHAPEDEAPPAG